MGIDPAHISHTRERRNSCEARPGLIQSTHIAPLNECLMAQDRESVPKHAPKHEGGRVGHSNHEEAGEEPTSPLDPPEALLRFHLVR
jgi:hypothetical protein